MTAFAGSACAAALVANLATVIVWAVIASAGNSVRQLVLTVLVLAWGTRLGWHVGRRSAGQGDDPRYADLLRKHEGTARGGRGRSCTCRR